MNALIYIYKKQFINRLKSNLKRPLSWIVLIIFVLYMFMVTSGLRSFNDVMRIKTVGQFATILMFMQLYLGTLSITSYLRRKGLIFRKPDIHFIFPAPVTPKQILMFANIKGILTSILMIGFILILGGIKFSKSWHLFVIYALVSFCTDAVFENAMVILCFGNEKLSKKQINYICYSVYVLLFIITLAFFLQISINTYSPELMVSFLSKPAIKLIPFIGWNIGFIQLVFVKVNAINIICTILYIAGSLILAYEAKKAPCTGEFFEDAEKFADKYEEIRKRSRKGESTFGVGRKQNLKAGKITYNGNFAKAIFYRQMLEYKKQDFFIFGLRSLIFFVIGLIIVIIRFRFDFIIEDSYLRRFMIPGIMAYFLVIFSGMRTKWEKELENPYTFMIPATKTSKTWNATKLEILKSFADAAILTVIGGIGLGLNPVEMVETILIFVGCDTTKLYFNMAIEALLKPSLDAVPILLTLIKIIVFSVLVSLSIAVAAIGTIMFNADFGVFMVMLLNVILAGFGLFISSTAFEHMES